MGYRYGKGHEVMASIPSQTEVGLIVGAMSLTTVELVKLWQAAAPTLEQVRAADPDDPAIQQRLMDANYLGAGLAILIGGSTSFLIRSWIPIVIALGSVVLVSKWWQWVYNADNEPMK